MVSFYSIFVFRATFLFKGSDLSDFMTHTLHAVLGKVHRRTF